jgi:ribonuclease D
MTSLPLAAPIWVDQDRILREMVSDLLSHHDIAVDTESNSLYVYHEQVCLIQFSTGQTDYLVDPLALDDLSPLAPVFANPEIQKIFHAAEYDILCLKRDFNFEFNNLFDTMLAGRILGLQALGLGGMLQDSFGIEIDKRYQRANWGERPLTAPLLAYARLDTHYLIQLRDRLLAELIRTNRLSLAQEDFVRLTALAGMSSENDSGSCFRITGSRDLSPAQTAVLNCLCEYRDQQARRANLPPFKILSNQTLLDMAVRKPATMEELARIDGMSPRLMRRYAHGLLSAIQRGISAAPIYRPVTQPRPSDDYLLRLDNLRTWRKETGQIYGVPSDVILPRDTLEAIALANPTSVAELGPLMEDIPWRFEKFASDIIRVLRNHH